MELKKDYIYNLLRRSIMDGSLPPGHRLPPEVCLARELQVGQVTLRSALARLEREGLIQRHRSRGTFVSERNIRKVFLFIIPDGAEDLETPSRYIAAGMDEAARASAITVERCPVSLFLTFSAEERREMVRRRAISGVIVETGHRRIDPLVAEAVRDLALPTVIPHGLPSDAADSGFLVLRTDEKTAFARAYEYIASRGHRDVASLFVRLPGEVSENMRGFTPAELRECISARRLNPAEELVAYLPNGQEVIREQLRRWLGNAVRPTAILCHSDRIAIRVSTMLREMKVRVPEEVSLMGYSNFPGSQLIQPALTTIDTRLHECAAMALKELLDAENWFRPEQTPKEILTPFSLIERESVAIATVRPCASL
ncbi:MAG: substrate-binding domain-containing protein [Lentisphaeria bacterium]|nr:substrate-binding domain-containing protein [Lentisphaeria bacterium]